MPNYLRWLVYGYEKKENKNKKQKKNLFQGSNFIMAIMAMSSDKNKMAMDKMKLYLKLKATFGPNGYFRKAHTYLGNCINFWLNLLNL